MTVITTPLTLEDNLRRARETRGLSGIQLANAAGVTPSMLSAYESGRVQPSVTVLVRLADALETTTDYLAGRTASMEAAGETTTTITQLLGSLSADEIQTVHDLIRTWTSRREPPPKVVHHDERWLTAEHLIRNRIRAAKGLPPEAE